MGMSTLKGTINIKTTCPPSQGNDVGQGSGYVFVDAGWGSETRLAKKGHVLQIKGETSLVGTPSLFNTTQQTHVNSLGGRRPLNSTSNQQR